MTQGFTKAFPDIRMEYTGGTGGDLTTKLRAERDGGLYSVDVFLAGTSTANLLVKPLGALDPIEPALILPEVTDPKYWRDNSFDYSDKEGKYNLVFISHIQPRLIYSPKLVKVEEVDEIHELLDPKWKGRFVINDPLPPGPGGAFFRWIWKLLGPQRASEYYRKIREHAGAVEQDQRRQIEWIAQGKYAFLPGSPGAVLFQLLERGLKVGVLPEFKDYGTWVSASSGSLMLINKAPHPNAAKVFTNWLLGKEGQTAWSKALGQTSRRADVSTDHLPSYGAFKPGKKAWIKDHKPGDWYWLSDAEESIGRSPEEEKILKELFGR
jgi:ABC-type Fe3+ transport system substrate-binding protein